MNLTAGWVSNYILRMLSTTDRVKFSWIPKKLKQVQGLPLWPCTIIYKLNQRKGTKYETSNIIRIIACLGSWIFYGRLTGICEEKTVT